MSNVYLDIGQVIGGRYEILREIGRGGNSVVYAARDRTVGSDVAIKLLVPPPLVAHIARERLRREVLAVRGLSHENIVGVHDLMEEGGSSLVVMELVDGPDLQARVRSRGSLSPDEAGRVGESIATALSEAHRRGILHRDVKPQNILLAADGKARLTDFGSARVEGQATVTQTGAFVGTMGYTAPEVLAGERGDARADVFALGMTLYFALLGKLPSRAAQSAVPAGGFQPRTSRPDVPEWLNAIIARATAAKPGDRFATAEGMANALRKRARDGSRAVVAESGVDFCIVCGAPEPHGASICARCAPAVLQHADTLVLIDAPASPADRDDTRRTLRALLPVVPVAIVERLLRGDVALARVPRATAETVLEQLARRQLRARTVSVNRSWSMIPGRFFAMLVLIVAIGVPAGYAAAPTLVWMSPIFAWLLFLLGWQTVQRPALVPEQRRSTLPSELDDRVTQTMSQLPAGSARALLSDIAQLAGALCGGGMSGRRSDEEQRLTVELVAAACDAATDLARLDETLLVLDGQRDRYDAPGDKWLEAMARTEGARDRLVQRLLEATSALGQARAQLAGGSADASARVAELARGLALMSRHRDEAEREVDVLLGTIAP
ncbi:MAG TPA: protein kinase [Gemmatimonadaceae bacterium]|nr:protein kinase [Gemmatimonadaceae bacterium]